MGEVSTGGEYGAFTPTLTLPRQGGENVLVRLAGDQCYSKNFERSRVKQDKSRRSEIFEDHVKFFANVKFFAKIALTGDKARKESNHHPYTTFSRFYNLHNLIPISSTSSRWKTPFTSIMTLPDKSSR